MGKNELTFTVFLIHALAEAWQISPQKVYETLSKTAILDDYIVQCYDALHTQGKKYLVEDITEFVHERGTIIYESGSIIKDL